MSETPPTATTASPPNGGGSTSGSSNQNNRRGNRGKNKKKSTHQSSWKAASSGFDGKYFSLANELGTGRDSNFKETMQKVEVYVAENFPKSAKSMRKLFNDPPSNPIITPPEEPTGANAESRLQIALHMDKVGRYHVAKDTLENNLHSLFTVLWGQCSPGVQGRLRGLTQFLPKKEAHDCSWLLEEIRQVMYNSSSGRYKLKLLYEAKLDLLKFTQGRLGVNEYFDTFMDKVDAFEYAGGELGQDHGILLYVDQHFEGLLDTAPGTPPISPPPPDLLELGGRNTFTVDEVEELTIPLETYISSVENYVADMSV